MKDEMKKIGACLKRLDVLFFILHPSSFILFLPL